MCHFFTSYVSVQGLGEIRSEELDVGVEDCLEDGPGRGN